MHSEVRNTLEIVVGNFKGRDHLADTSLDGRIIFKQIIKK
jgi:hypothetical protein